MQYLALIYGSENEENAMPEAAMAAYMKEFGEFTRDIIASGHYRAGNRLHPVSKATTVRVRKGKRSITDGPFCETKEQLGGYYLFEANGLDEAIDLAARIPWVRFGSIEVRPIVPSRVETTA